jgi:hypothetical protein
MTLLGFQVELLLLVQLLVTTFIITIYAVLTSLQEAKSDQLSKSHIILLLSFLFDHHPDYKSIPDIAEAKAENINDENLDIYWLTKYFDRLHNSGVLPTVEDFEGSPLWHNLLILLFAPLTSPLITFMMLDEERKYRFKRLMHTEMRKNIFSKYIILLSGNLIALFTALILVFPKSAGWGYVILIIGTISTITSLIGMAANVWWQMSWKEFWQDKLLDVMAKASVGTEKNHDIFNRAMILKNYIESQPDVPLPGNFGFYVSIYSGVQLIILLVYNLIQKSQ